MGLEFQEDTLGDAGFENHNKYTIDSKTDWIKFNML